MRSLDAKMRSGWLIECAAPATLVQRRSPASACGDAEFAGAQRLGWALRPRDVGGERLGFRLQFAQQTSELGFRQGGLLVGEATIEAGKRHLVHGIQSSKSP